jgi:hypothetical protein
LTGVGPRVARFFSVQRTKTGKIYQNVPNGHKISIWPYKKCKHLQLQDLPKLTQIGIFILKTYHLATLAVGNVSDQKQLFLGFL